MNPLLNEEEGTATVREQFAETGFRFDSLVARIAFGQQKSPEVPVKRRLVDLQSTIVGVRLNPENRELWADALVGFLHAALASGFSTDEIMLAAHEKFDAEIRRTKEGQ